MNTICCPEILSVKMDQRAYYSCHKKVHPYPQRMMFKCQFSGHRILLRSYKLSYHGQVLFRNIRSKDTFSLSISDKLLGKIFDERDLFKLKEQLLEATNFTYNGNNKCVAIKNHENLEKQ